MNIMGKKSQSEFMRIRKWAGLTQQQLADELGVHRNAVSNWERGLDTPRLTIPQTKKLCEVLGITLEQLPDNFGPTPTQGDP